MKTNFQPADEVKWSSTTSQRVEEKDVNEGEQLKPQVVVYSPREKTKQATVYRTPISRQLVSRTSVALEQKNMLARLSDAEQTRIASALTQLSDWSKWSITAQTALIGAIAFIFKSAERSNFGDSTLLGVKIIATLGIIAFLISILSATVMLLAVPGNISRLADEVHTNWRKVGANHNFPYLSMPVFGEYSPLRRKYPLAKFVYWQQWFGMLGIVLLSLLIILMIWGA